MAGLDRVGARCVLIYRQALFLGMNVAAAFGQRLTGECAHPASAPTERPAGVIRTCSYRSVSTRAAKPIASRERNACSRSLQPAARVRPSDCSPASMIKHILSIPVLLRAAQPTAGSPLGCFQAKAAVGTLLSGRRLQKIAIARIFSRAVLGLGRSRGNRRIQRCD